MKIEFRSKRRGFAPAAMADIAFLLLVFFITTMSIDEDAGIQLPRFGYTEETGFPATVRVALAADGSLFADGEPTDLESLPYVLGAVSPESLVIMLEGDARAPYKKIDEVLLALSGAGYRNIVLVAEAAAPASGAGVDTDAAGDSSP